MNFKRLTCGSAIAPAVSASVLTVGSGVAVTQPGPAPCQFGDCQGPAARHQAAPVDRVGPVDRLLLVARRRGTTTPPRGHRRPIRACAALMTACAITSRSTPWVTPIYNPDFNNWGFWLFGIWIPL